MILIIDDDITIRTSLSFLLKRAGHDTHAVGYPREALEFVRRTSPNVIMMDMNFSLTTSGQEGLDLLVEMRKLCPYTPVVLMTAWGSIQLAVKGMRLGAFDFITKPWNNIAMLGIVDMALEINAKELLRQGSSKSAEYTMSKIIGTSDAIKEVKALIKQVAKTNASVLITGESGTGKELVAEAIHGSSPRSDKSFVKVNLGGISSSLFESEMFGHKKGAFTDAYADREGRFSVADKGTIFLDEIGDLEPSSQVKLLRVLQEGTFEKLGESLSRKVNVRVVSATNKDLSRMVANGAFREDLFFRINLIPIHLPALRDRIEDIPLLIEHFASQAATANSLGTPSFTVEAITYLQTLPYKGNVRELKNLVERALIMSPDNKITRSSLERLRFADKDGGLADMTLEQIERQRIEKVLIDSKYNISKAAMLLGVSRTALYRRLEKYSIPYNK
ncbi:MAG: sigma-54 dependent transcriptional regulator [Rikenellaceae bacterium]